MEIGNIDDIYIKDFFSIEDIELKGLKDKKEIYIVGENGDGKTLLLQAILIALVGVKTGEVFDFILMHSDFSLNLLIRDSHNKKYSEFNKKKYPYILAYGASRNNYCQMKEDTTGYLTLFTGEYDLKNPVKWLQYLDYSEKADKKNIITVIEAKKLLQYLLNSDIDIEINPDKVIFTEKGSYVSFEQLSAGYKSVIIIICDLIARFSEKQQVESINDFQGVVLIDEIELHLHPKMEIQFHEKTKRYFSINPIYSNNP